MSDADSPEARPGDPLELLTVEDLVRLLQVKRSWIYTAVAADALPHVRLGRHVRFRRATVEALLRASESGGAPAS